MSKDVAVISETNEVIAINVHRDDYELAQNEVLVTNPAYIGGDYIEGWFYPPQPYPSWTRSEGSWIPPVPMPSEGTWSWDETAQEWIEVTV
jgi:hypothetical protein